MEAAVEEQRLQLESALQFDLHEYQLGDQVTWQVPHEGIEGRGELIAIGDPIEFLGDDGKKRLKWGGSSYVQLWIIESSILRPKRKGSSKVADTVIAMSERYAPGRSIELKKHQITGKIRRGAGN